MRRLATVRDANYQQRVELGVQDVFVEGRQHHADVDVVEDSLPDHVDLGTAATVLSRRAQYRQLKITISSCYFYKKPYINVAKCF